ncbi:DUF2326 domain-containing protein [Shewanella sp. GutDb-MelDb]|uniref:DUF2326 domain-containing protein n=1 Tax=Shewanella sp. GutDb-MelDb TaxID=2058316 RepID=UPI000C7B3D97|nr:DUF2326 domain-containing protein [Shewanella sp. GutDb-MelDb]PKG55237.1 DUF2326 domain-containing protein [Shewanella sp. GutDb-MelDb]
MQLRNLTVSEGHRVIRNIDFQDGINIITSKDDDGNQVGKSTTLRVINFCLGSNGDSIWKDPDSKTVNESVYQLVTGGLLTFTLKLNVNGIDYSVTRKVEAQLTKKGTRLRRLSWINEQEYSSQDKFKTAVAKIFGYDVEKPSYNSVKSRFVRLDKGSSGNVFRFNSFFTSNDEYTLIYSHIFGFDGHHELTQEFELIQEIKTLQLRSSFLLNGSKESELSDKVSSIDDALELLYLREDSYDITGIQNEAIEKLRVHRSEIITLSNEITNLETKEIYNQRTIKNYRTKVAHVDSTAIKAIYDEALTLVPNLTKTFDEAVEFHNAIFIKKAQYVEKQSGILNSKLARVKNLLNQQLGLEKKLFKSLSNESHLSGFILIEQAIQEKREERGRLTYVLDEVSLIRDEVNGKNNKIAELRAMLESYMGELATNLTRFNTPLKSITTKLFKSFSLQLKVNSEANGSLTFSTVNEDKVSGDGAPRAASMAFDMAMVEYVKESKAKLPQFTLQDYLESIDEEKLSELMILANKRKIQTVISVLNDKLQLVGHEFVTQNRILELSVGDKFFKV